MLNKKPLFLALFHPLQAKKKRKRTTKRKMTQQKVSQGSREITMTLLRN